MSLFDKLFGKRQDDAEHQDDAPASLPASAPVTEDLPGQPVTEHVPAEHAAADHATTPEPSGAGAAVEPTLRPQNGPSLVESTRSDAAADLEPQPRPATLSGPRLVGSPASTQAPDEATTDQSADPQRTIQEMRSDPNFVRVFDQYGQEIFLTRQQWREEVLPGNLQAQWNSPDELYAVMLNAMNDGFFAEIEPASAHLYEIDTNLVRGACVRAIVLLQLGRIEEGESILDRYLEQHGEGGAVLTNLAKVYAARNEMDRAEKTLWRSIELDPNLENGLGWYLSIEFERGGEEARQRAMLRIAAIPGSWRVRLWLAKAALAANELPRALELYREGLASFPGPVPTEFLYPMSGDLGMAGQLRELLDLTEPRFLPEVHGVLVGNNLIKAHVDLGEIEPAMSLVNRLFAMRRPDWRETLSFWESTISRMRAAGMRAPKPGQLEIGMLETIGPVWKRHGGDLSEVFGSKSDSATVVTILGGTAELSQQPNEQLQMQLADALGRLSRALPLFLAEQVEFTTAAQARSLLPRVSGAGGGFVLRGGEWADAEAIELAREGELEPAFVVKAHVDARAQDWIISATVLRASDNAVLGVARETFPAGQPELAVVSLATQLRALLVDAGIAAETSPKIYRLPEGPMLANYLLRLEQLLAVRSAISTGDQPVMMSGEREILEGTLWLALQLGDNATVRALLASTVVAMDRIRPDILPEFAERFAMLQRDLPLGEPLDEIITDMLTD